jgi:hypothetical protein
MITYRIIKNIVENESNIEDLSVKDRHEYIRDCRYVYMRLCEKHIKKFKLLRCANEINKTHGAVINGLKKFEYDYDTPYFKANGIYDICNNIIKDIKLKSKDVNLIESEIKFLSELKQAYINN